MSFQSMCRALVPGRPGFMDPRLPQQLRQLGDVGGDAPGLVAGEQLGRCAAARLLLEIDVGERLPVGVADDEAPPMQLGVGLVDGPGRRKRRWGSRRNFAAPPPEAPHRLGNAFDVFGSKVLKLE